MLQGLMNFCDVRLAAEFVGCLQVLSKAGLLEPNADESVHQPQ